ncbi:MAG: DUF4870 domain-containing protein, partial [Tetrasphaera sp.]|nr:DUF4870 domain-containing protein [Tetrasphaera sp.]
FMYKDRGPFVRANAANSLNVQLTALIWSIISVIMMITIILLPVGIIGA